MQLLSDSAIACAGWLDFEISGFLLGILVGGTIGFLIGLSPLPKGDKSGTL